LCYIYNLSFIASINNLNILPHNNPEQTNTIHIQSTIPINSAVIDPIDLYGMVIGVSDYFGSYDDRPFADTDAEAFYSILIDDYGCDPEKIYLLIDQSATKENIFSLFDNISSFVDGNDKFILYSYFIIKTYLLDLVLIPCPCYHILF